MSTESIPEAPPRKRRHLEAAPDKHLAVWLADPALTESDAKRLAAEKERRKKRRRVEQRNVGLLVSSAGVTPSAVAVLMDELQKLKPTEMHMPYSQPNVYRAANATGALVRVYRDLVSAEAEIVMASDTLIGLPPSMQMPERKQDAEVWRGLRRAKDRGVDVRVIWPNGELLVGRW